MHYLVQLENADYRVSVPCHQHLRYPYIEYSFARKFSLFITVKYSSLPQHLVPEVLIRILGCAMSALEQDWYAVLKRCSKNQDQ